MKKALAILGLLALLSSPVMAQTAGGSSGIGSQDSSQNFGGMTQPNAGSSSAGSGTQGSMNNTDTNEGAGVGSNTGPSAGQQSPGASSPTTGQKHRRFRDLFRRHHAQTTGGASSVKGLW